MPLAPMQVHRTIDARIDCAAGEVALVRERFTAPIDVRGESNDCHHLQLSMLPANGAARNRAAGERHAGRFSPLGELFLLPAHADVDIIGNCREQRALVCRLDTAGAARWLGQEFEWTGQRLTRGLDIPSGELRRLPYPVAAELESNAGLCRAGAHYSRCLR